jgi:hypothetical protein
MNADNRRLEWIGSLVVLACTVIGCARQVSPAETKPVTHGDIIALTQAVGVLHDDQEKATAAFDRLSKSIATQSTVASKKTLDEIAEAFQAAVHDELHEHRDSIQREVESLKVAVNRQPIIAEQAPPTRGRGDGGKEEDDDGPTECSEVRSNKRDGSVRSLKTENQRPKTRYSGIIMETRDPDMETCIPCRWALRGFDLDLKGAGWTIGSGPDYHVWLKYVDGETPVFKIVRDGKLVETIRGFHATDDKSAIDEMRRIMAKHPNALIPMKRSDKVKRSNGVSADSSLLHPSSVIAPNSPLAQTLWIPASPHRWVPASSSPLSRIPPGTGRWGWPGASVASLKRHLSSTPHNYWMAYLNSLNPRQLERLHSGEHEKHASVTGIRAPYFPGWSGPFYGSLK